MKIKEIKIRENDGSYSDAIPVGVDAINADYKDSNVETELDKLNNENKNRKNDISILQNKDIDLQNQIKSLASGSPKGTYMTITELITANPETGVYIITNNGHIYSWTKNGTDAVDLGVYQAAEFEDNSINYNHLRHELKSCLDPNFIIINDQLTFIPDYYIRNDGNIVTASTAGLPNGRIQYVEVNVVPNECYRITALCEGNAPSYVIKDASNIILKMSEVRANSEIITIPTNGNKLYVNNWLNTTNRAIIEKLNNVNVNDSILESINNCAYITKSLRTVSNYPGYVNYTHFSCTADSLNLRSNDVFSISFNFYTKYLDHVLGACLYARVNNTWLNCGNIDFNNNGKHLFNRYDI